MVLLHVVMFLREACSNSYHSTPSIQPGGAYIPPARLRMMQQQITDKSRWAGGWGSIKICPSSRQYVTCVLTAPTPDCSEAYQRLSWEALKKSIHGLINKVSAVSTSIVLASISAVGVRTVHVPISAEQ